MIRKILPIVEGDSEVNAIPVLLRRIINRVKAFEIQIDKPWLVKRDQVIHKEGVIENKIRAALIMRDDVSAIIIILDADSDCPVEIAANLLQRCRVTTQIPISVIMAKSKLECWFLGAKESLQGVRGIKADAETPEDPESLGIGRLKNNMEKGFTYHKVYDPPAFAAKMDIDMAIESCPSFARFVRETERLIEECQD